MFQWPIFLIILGASVPGLFLAIPGIVRGIYKAMLDKADDPSSVSFNRIFIFTLAQNLIYLVSAAALGTLLSYRVGLNDLFIDSLAAGSFATDLLVRQLLAGVGFGGVYALIYLLAYYLVFYPHLDAQTAQTLDNLRMNAGLSGRLFYAGITEEVIARWGAQTLFTWLGMLVVDSTAPAVYWAAILIAGFFFALWHIPGYRLAGCTSPLFYLTLFSLNTWSSIVLGWLFWQYGLIAAITAHALRHLIWVPVEKIILKQ